MTRNMTPADHAHAVPPPPGTPRRLRVLVANEDADRLGPLVGVIAGIGHDVIARAVDVALVAEATISEQPDVALVSVGPSADHALEMIDRIVSEAACPVVLLLHAPDPALVEEASRRGVFAAITDREPGEWQSAIEVVLRRYADYDGLRTAFARRATIERASGILMERHSMSSDAAFQMLRDSARNGNRKLAELAAAVLEGHALLPAGESPGA